MNDSEVVIQLEQSIVEIRGTDLAIVDREIVSIVSEGIQGPPGPPGASGAGFVHTQGSAATEWIVNHNLGFKPSVEIFDAGGREVEADVLHMSDNQVRIYFTSAVAGTARCV